MSATVAPQPPLSRRMKLRFLAAAWSSPGNALVTMLVIAGTLVVLAPFVRWALVDATWSGTAASCRAEGSGACWAFVWHKVSFILFGLFPPAERWRAATATGVLVALIGISAHPRQWTRRLPVIWAIGLSVGFWLMHGGAGLGVVPASAWGGLPITLALTTIGLAAGLPLGILLALGRTSVSPMMRAAAGAVVEVVRGIPLIAVLYVAALVVPLTLPRGIEIHKLALAQLGVAVFAAAYLAEAVRSGLQLMSRGQRDAALALGLTHWRAHRLVILPQALRVVIPSLVSIAVGFFQDTSLVVIIGIFDLLNTARVAAQDPDWLGFHREGFLFVGAIYFMGSAALSRYGLWLEQKLSPAAGLIPRRREIR